MDSTHKTNRYDYHLFTLYIRDSYGCWDAGAHFFVSNENSDTITEALKIIQNNYCQWTLQYMLLDQSNIEVRSIKNAFPGLNSGEQEVEVIFCIVHVMRTWMSKIYDKKACDSMIIAMHKRTKIGCKRVIQDTLEACQVSAIKNYIKRNYMNNTH